MSYKETFTNIYENYGFGSTESHSGPGSTLEETKLLREQLKTLIQEKGIKSIVDIPCGDFHWMKEMVFSFEKYIGGDIVEECIKENLDKYGSKRIDFINFDILTDSIPKADLLLVRDIIGHFPVEDGQKIVDNILKSDCKYLLSTTWYNIQDKEYYKRHDNRGTEYGRFYPVNLMSQPFNFPEPDTVIVENVQVEDHEKGNRKVLALWELDKVRKHLETNISEVSEKYDSDLTVVTGLWNIGRPGRSFDHYIECFQKLLETPQNMFIYIPQEYEYLVWEKRSRENTRVKIAELEYVKNMYAPFWDKTQEIRISFKWRTQSGWLDDSPQAELEYYNPIVQSKMFFLNDVTIWNPFNTEYFIWLDAGITNTVYDKYFSDADCLSKIIPYLNTFLFLSYPYQANNEIHGFDFKGINRYAREEVKYVCRGGLFGGHKDFINQANGTYYHLLQNTLSEGYMGTEESIFSIMAHLEPHIYKRFALDENGLVVKFVQALLDDTVVLENNISRYNILPKGSYNEITTKTSLYMLTFNFPEQVEHTLQAWQASSSDWLSKSRKILIDNSTDPEAKIGNQKVAERNDFEYIALEGNTGINGGRLFAAEHFAESDSDYYFFFEDDMGFFPYDEKGYCRNGLRKYVPDLYKRVHEIMVREEFDFLKLSFTEVYMDNNIQVSWYNIPQTVRTDVWPDYDQLPASGLDPYCPRTKFDRIETHNGLSYITGEIYYCNWPMIVSKKGNQKMFLDVKWAHPYEQTWMSYMFQETIKGNIKPAVLLASPILHDRIVYYKPEERREN